MSALRERWTALDRRGRDRSPLRLVALAFGVAALALGAAACNWERAPERKKINSWLAEPSDLENVRRVMVLPFAEESGVACEPERVREAFVNELQKLRRFEVVPLPATAEEDDVLHASLRAGRVSTAAVVELCRRYHLDGVLLGTITAWRAYTPPHLGLRTQLVSVHSGSPIWAVDAMFDTNDATTIDDLRLYADRFQADDGTLHDWQLITIAPTKFAGYVSHRVVGTWIED